MKTHLLTAFLVAMACFGKSSAAETFVPPASPNATYNFNPGWKFIREDVTNAEQVDFDDSQWADVSAPHTYNDVDSYQKIISHSGGDRGAWSGIVWYRKHFKLPAGAKDGKVFLEFEGLKQAGRFWVNGKFVGKYENGITPLGLDLTGFVNFGDKENVIAVKVDNSNDYVEEATGVPFEWMGRAFNPNYGGLNHDIWLRLTGKVYQTLPLYENLKTTGIYIYPSDIDISGKTCDVNIESQVRNESGDQQSITLSAVVVDADGKVCAKLQGDTSDLVDGETEILKAGGELADAKFWSDDSPQLYDVYCLLAVNDKVVDVQKITTGFRKTEFKGGAGTGGVYLNGKFVWLTGYSQRSADSWAGLGEAYPDWMHDYNAQLIRSTHANYIRWMHISPQAVDVRACDKAGIVEVCPAGDKEKDATGRQWEQRVEVMRDSIIYFRNSPSILFWEAGNTVITPDHMRQMVELRKEYDPHGGRVMGTRDNDVAALNTAITPIAEYYGVMIGQDPRTDELTHPLPAAIADDYSIFENSVTNLLRPLDNDLALTPGGRLTIVGLRPTNGVAVLVGGTNVLFTPDANFTGVAAIGYTITDGMGGTNKSLITVTVTNQPMVANPDHYSVAENSVSNVLKPLDNDVLPTPGGRLTIVSLSPTNGVAGIADGTNVLFTPDANFTSVATIGYTITDGMGGTNSSLMTVTVANRADIFRGFSLKRRNRAPLIETEDFRDEAARRFWDDYSPPFFGFKPGPNDVYHWNSETFCLAAAVRYHDYFINIITNTDPAHAKWSGYASIYWSDANADGRQDSSEVCRVSGKVDAVRLPKQAYYVYRVMQSGTPDLHIIGHWTYPTNTVKTVYVAANHCDSVELFVNGKSLGSTNKPCDFVDTYGQRDKNLGNTGFIYAFPAVHFEPGEIKAAGKAGDKIVAQDEIETAGPPKAIRLTVHTDPGGLQANGSDVAFIDFEAVDAKGERCPTDQARVDFKVEGPAIWRGGYDSGITNSVNNLWLDTECGINRVAIRSTLTPGVITLTATRSGLEPATVKIESQPAAITDGLMHTSD